jgi:hypothetical protein
MWTREEVHEAGLDVFANFLSMVWAHLGLPEPDEVQLEFAHFLQYGPKRLIIEAFRGAGKTWITGAFAVWNLFLNPQINILIVSASQGYADKIATFIGQIIGEMEILSFLRPREGQRSSVIAFDVGPARPNPVPSVSSVGLGGQMTGNRSDIVIADDCETPKNSYTDLLRVKLRETVKEFEALLKPAESSEIEPRVIYLGTPHTEETLYNKLRASGYTLVVWPAEIPEFPAKYKGALAPKIQARVDAGEPAGTPVEPKRHSRDELAGRLVSFGFTQYQMQYMLDPSPADRDRLPLRTGDLLVYDFDEKETPIRFVWSRDGDYTIQNYPSGGLDGDVWRSPMFVSPERSDYQGTVMCIDPSGKGTDETGYSIVRYAQGLLYWVACGGFKDGLSDETQQALATLAVTHRVTHVALEPNYGGGAFGQLLKPWLVRIAEKLKEANPDMGYFIPSLVEDMKWSRGQKEVRILDVLEPLIQSHKIIVSRDLIDKEMRQMELSEDQRYSVIYQMTRLTRLKGCLAHDDRIESLAMCGEYWAHRMARDQVKMVQRYREEERMKELHKLMKISRMGGVMFTDNRIGRETPKDRNCIQPDTGNTPFNWREAFGNRG